MAGIRVVGGGCGQSWRLLLVCCLSIGIFALVLPANAGKSQDKKSKTSRPGLKAQILPPLGLPADPDNPYDPNATSWPINRPPLKGQVSQLQAGAYSSTSPGVMFGGGNKAKGSYIYKAGSKSPLLLTGGVEENVPRTPDDVAKYLRRMKEIINQYDRVVASTLLGSTGLNTDQASIDVARQETQQLISRIRATIPPADLKETHGRLADTMSAVGSFLSMGGGGGFDVLTKCMALTGEVHTTMDDYHRGVTACISHYGLAASLDPFSDEDPALKSKFAQQSQQFQNQRMGELQGQMNSQAGGLGSLLGGGASGGLESLFGGSSSSGPGGLGSLLGGGGGIDLGGLLKGGNGGDLGGLLKSLPGLLGGGQETGSLDP